MTVTGDRGSLEVPGSGGQAGPLPRQYRDPHVYARDVLSGAGNCVCGAALGDRLHVQAAPGVKIPDRLRQRTLRDGEAGRDAQRDHPQQ